MNVDNLKPIPVKTLLFMLQDMSFFCNKYSVAGDFLSALEEVNPELGKDETFISLVKELMKGSEGNFSECIKEIVSV
jgi:hypothetical protein